MMTRCLVCGRPGRHAPTCLAEYTPGEALENLGSTYRHHRDEAERARLALTAVIVDAAAAGVTEVDIARFAGVDRMTVRKALGKKR